MVWSSNKTTEVEYSLNLKASWVHLKRQKKKNFHPHGWEAFSSPTNVETEVLFFCSQKMLLLTFFFKYFRDARVQQIIYAAYCTHTNFLCVCKKNLSSWCICVHLFCYCLSLVVLNLFHKKLKNHLGWHIKLNMGSNYYMTVVSTLAHMLYQVMQNERKVLYV